MAYLMSLAWRGKGIDWDLISRGCVPRVFMRTVTWRACKLLETDRYALPNSPTAFQNLLRQNRRLYLNDTGNQPPPSYNQYGRNQTNHITLPVLHLPKQKLPDITHPPRPLNIRSRSYSVPSTPLKPPIQTSNPTSPSPTCGANTTFILPCHPTTPPPLPPADAEPPPSPGPSSPLPPPLPAVVVVVVVAVIIKGERQRDRAMRAAI